MDLSCALTYLFLFLHTGNLLVAQETNANLQDEPVRSIGCLFEDICHEYETCINDNVFGTCVNYNLSPVEPQTNYVPVSGHVKPVFNELFGLKFRWNDQYVQCFLRTTLAGAKLDRSPNLEDIIKSCGSFSLEGNEPPMRQNYATFLRRAPVNLHSDTLIYTFDSLSNAGPTKNPNDNVQSQTNDVELPVLTTPNHKQHYRQSETLISDILKNYDLIHQQLTTYGTHHDRQRTIDQSAGNGRWLRPELPVESRHLSKKFPVLLSVDKDGLENVPKHHVSRNTGLRDRSRPRIENWMLNRVIRADSNAGIGYPRQQSGSMERTGDIFIKQPASSSKMRAVATSRRLSRNLIIGLSVFSGLALIALVVVTTYIWCSQHSPKKQANGGARARNVEYSDVEHAAKSTRKRSLIDKMKQSLRIGSVDQMETSASPLEAIDQQKEGFQAKSPQSLQRNSSASQQSSLSSWSAEPVISGIDPSTGHLILSYMEGYLNNEDRLTLEWEAISSYEAEEATSSEVAALPENRAKNRSQAPLPFEQSRVRLRNTDNDYINASLLFDHSPRNPTYIATQSPLLETLSDFWQMIWEQTSVIIVCLERANELKPSDYVSNMTTPSDASVQYWPNEGVRIFGKFEVHLVSEHNWCEEYVVRSFYLKNLETGETRTVTQFHYLAWNDVDLRTMSKSLLEFRRKVNRSFRGMMSPIIVHCTDGSGRTGTYVLLDLVLNRISKGVREINIAATLEHLRDQRPKMVQSKDQYEFVFAAVAQEVEAMLKTNGHSG